jgi:hypothetical protein
MYLNKIYLKKTCHFKHYFFIILLFSFISCKNDVEYIFNKLITIEENNYEKTFPSYDLEGIENIKNKYYRQLYKKGKLINGFLLEKVYSDKLTNWHNYPFLFNMSEGDIAVELLLGINKEIDFYKIIPNEILEEYNKNGARIWWDYLHKNKEEIIKLIKENI